MNNLMWWLVAVAVLLAGLVLEWPHYQIYVALLSVAVAWLATEVLKLGGGARDNYRKMIKLIEHGKPVEPKHNPPTYSVGGEKNKRIFQDFAGFANFVNQRLDGGGWRIQEQPYDSVGGRVYAILYNGGETGRLTVNVWTLEYKTGGTELSVRLSVWSAQLFEYYKLRSFLRTMASIVCSDTAEVDKLLTAHLWNSVQTPTTLEPLSMQLKGQCAEYFEQGELPDESRKRYWESLQRKMDRLEPT